MAVIALRPVEDGDLDALFDQMRDLLRLLIDLVPARPLYARAASDNAGSLRMLKKAGFQAVGTECSFSPARKTEIEETILRKD